MSRLKRAALTYAARGWPVFPLRPRDKQPITENGFKDATVNLDTVDEWWNATPDANIGFCPGRAGLVVVDVDGPDGHRAAAQMGLLSEPTLTVITGRPGGFHLYFKHPGGRVSNASPATGVDIRGDDGYVVLPPSTHPSGTRYRWDKAEILPFPPGLILHSEKTLAMASPVGSVIGEGGRNKALTSLAGTLRRRGLEAAEMMPLLETVNEARCRPPLSAGELQAIALSVARYPAAAPIATDAPGETVVTRNARIGGDAKASIDHAPDAVSWPWPGFTRQFGGIVPGWLYVIGARPANGKTTLLLNLLSHLWERQERALYFGTEMAANQLLKKWAASRLGLNELHVFEHRIGAEHREELAAEIDRLLAPATVTFCEAARLSLDKLATEIAWACGPDSGLQPRVVVVDHLHRISQDREELEHLAVELKTIAQERNLALIVAAQLNRDEQEKTFDLYFPPTMGRYKGSSAIEENADIGLGLFRPLKSGTPVSQLKLAARGEVEIQSLAKADVMGVICLKHRYSGGALHRIVELSVRGGKLVELAPDGMGAYDSRARAAGEAA